MEIRILKSDDLHLLDKFLEESNSLYNINESEQIAWQWYRKNLEQCRKGLILSAAINELGIHSIACGFAVDILYNSMFKKLPYWVAGLVRSIDISFARPDIKIDSLMMPISQIFENSGYKTFYVVRNIPKTINYHNIVSYIEKVQNKNFPTPRYNVFLDRFINNPAAYKDFDLIKHIIPTSVPDHKKVAIFRYDLKYEFCKA